MDEGATSAKIRRAFRKGAQRIHPDKCDLPGAEVAFKLLAAAADTALAVTPVSSRFAKTPRLVDLVAGPPSQVPS